MPPRNTLTVGQFIDTRHVGGAERVLFDLSRKLHERGVGIEVLHLGNAWLAAACADAGISHTVLPWVDDYKHKERYLRFVWHFGRYLRRRRLTLLHTHLLGPVTGAALPARLAGIPVVGTLHDTFSVEGRPYAMRLLDAAALFGTRLVTVSRNMQRTFERQPRMGWTRFETIYNGTGYSAPDPEARRRSRARLGLDQAEVVAISVGRLTPVKGYDVLLRAFARLDPPLRLLIVGHGELEAPLRLLAGQLGISHWVQFLGYRDDVAELLQAGDLFVLASRSEGLSCSIIEAMGAALPAVVTDVGGNRELVEEGRSGFLVPAEDPAALAERIQQLRDEPERRHVFARQAAERAASLFDLEAMVDRYLTAYARRQPLFAAYRRPAAGVAVSTDG